ncbi:protein S100-A16 isoform X1 [Corapipo altera]|nr:protein S100-A16 isoform X1 [Corapipo altera]
METPGRDQAGLDPRDLGGQPGLCLWGARAGPALPCQAVPGAVKQEEGWLAAMSQCTELEWAVQVLVNNFDKYSSRCCCCKKPRRISKKDFRKMLSRELNHMLTDTGNRRAADKLICDLDENKDGRISFDEYWTLIGGIASPIAQIIRQQEQSIKFTK